MKTKNLKFSIIVCTLGNRITEFERLINSLKIQTYSNFELIVVSQGNHDFIEDALERSKLQYLHLKTDIRGLSRARNIGLKNVRGEIITVSDDDCWYPMNAFEKAFSLIETNKERYNVFCFKIFDPEKEMLYKSYANMKKNISWLQIGKISSIEIFVINNELSKDINFDENFGLGALYPSGEENIYIHDLLLRGSKIVFLPEIIVYHTIPIIEKYRYSTLKLLTVKKMFVRMFGKVKGHLVYLLFYIKHYKRIKF